MTPTRDPDRGGRRSTGPARQSSLLVLVAALLAVPACSAAGRHSDAANMQSLTFAHDVAPLLHEHCVTCHRPGGAGPFSLLQYDDVKKRARQIVKVTGSRYMPPWPPEPGDVKFVGERRLPPVQIDLIRRWVEQGAPRGDPATLPPPLKFPAGWQLGQPDLVLTQPRPYTLPASGADVFRNFVFSVPAGPLRYVRAVEIQAGQKRVVHHANIVVDTGRALRARDEEDPDVGFPGMDVQVAASAQFDPDSHFLFWKPGSPPVVEPDDMAWPLAGGADLVLNTHLQPSGKPESIQPSIALYFTDRRPTRFPMLLQLEHDGAIDIPPGASDFELTDMYKMPVDAYLLGVYPHAHFLGKDLLGMVTFPDGSQKTLIRIKDWDLNWQAVYQLETPLSLPRGSVLSMRYVYDNSSRNPRNPNEPPKRVVAGNRTSDEMGHLWVQVLPRNREDRLVLQEALMRRRLEKYPGDVIAHANLGAALQSLGHLGEAIVHLREVVRITPADALARNNLGAALEASGRADEAIAAFREAIRLQPRLTDAHYNLGNMLLAKGESLEAAKHFERVLRERPDDADALNDLGTTLAMQGQLSRAALMFGDALRLDSSNGYAHYNLAEVLAREGRLREAITHYESALKALPGDADVRQHLARARARVAEIRRR